MAAARGKPESQDANRRTAEEARKEEVRVGWRMAALGMTTATEVAAGALLGWLADRVLGTSNGVLIGAILGIIVGLWSLVKGSMTLMKQLDAKYPTRPQKPRSQNTDDQFSKFDRNGNDADNPDRQG